MTTSETPPPATADKAKKEWFEPEFEVIRIEETEIHSGTHTEGSTGNS